MKTVRGQLATFLLTSTFVALSAGCGGKGGGSSASTGDAGSTNTSGSTSGLGSGGAALLAIDVEPQVPSLPAGYDQQFTATGIYSDGSKADLGANVAWSTDRAQVATVSASGLVHTVGAGSTAVTATLGAVAGSTALTVTSATLTSVEVDPPTTALAYGTAGELVATGIYSDGSQLDVTARSTWSSSDATAVSVALADGHAFAQGVAGGAAATVTATFDGVSGSAAVTVSAAPLASLTVTPATFGLARGVTQQLTLTGTLADASAQDLTSDPGVAWSSSDPSIATVSGAPGSVGLVTGLAAGTATITATLLGLHASATVTVSAATVVSIALTPAGAQLPAGYTRQLTATATYTDGATLDVTGSATWMSSAPGVAAVSTLANPGLVTTVSPGTATITAAFQGVSGSTPFTVTNAVLQRITVTPAPFTVEVGKSVTLTATGTFSDGTTADLTKECFWTSTPRSTAWVTKRGPNAGTLTGSRAGSVTATAKLNGLRGQASCTVQ